MPRLRVLPLAFLLFAPLAAPALAEGAHHRAYVFCDQAQGLQCGATYKEVDRDCQLVASHGADALYLCQGSGQETGIGVDYAGDALLLCGSSPGECIGVNAGLWSCPPHGACYVVLEMPSGFPDALVLDPVGPKTVCVWVEGRAPNCV